MKQSFQHVPEPSAISEADCGFNIGKTPVTTLQPAGIKIVTMIRVLMAAVFVVVLCYNIMNAEAASTAGFRASRILSSYPGNQFPEPGYWEMVGRSMADRFTGFQAGGIWIVSLYLSNPEGYTLLNFPNPGVSLSHVYFSGKDENEAWLEHFDTTGVMIWLQIEPGGADIDTLISIVLNRYSHHSCVAGFGVDVEWYQTYDYSGGKKVSNADAQRWEEKVRSVNPEYSLFLKHYSKTWMPDTYRGDIVFIDDSQDFTWASNSLTAMVSEFKSWGQTFSPNPVGFQFGYEADRGWWSLLQDPPGNIGNALIANISNCRHLFWVDFTVTDVFPPTGIIHKSRKEQRIWVSQNYPNPFNAATIITYSHAQQEDLRFNVTDMNGRIVFSKNYKNQPAGNYHLSFNGGNLPSGVYFYTLASGSGAETGKMVLIK